MRICLVILLFGLTLIGCNEPPATAKKESNPPAAGETAASDDKEQLAQEFVIDVRSQAEWDEGHLEQAVLIPHTEIADRIASVTEDKSAKIVVYCKVGGRAGKAKTALEEMGYTNVENGGGYEDLKKRYEQ